MEWEACDPPKWKNQGMFLDVKSHPHAWGLTIYTVPSSLAKAPYPLPPTPTLGPSVTMSNIVFCLKSAILPFQIDSVVISVAYPIIYFHASLDKCPLFLQVNAQASGKKAILAMSINVANLAYNAFSRSLKTAKKL